MEDWAEIRRLHRAEAMPIKAIARRLGISKNTVRRALSAAEPPVYRRPAHGSIVDAVDPQIRALLKEFPEMPATVIAERIGWERSLTVLKDRVRALRPVFRPVDPASRTVYQPGELAQCDLWFPPVDVPLGAGQVGRPPVLVLVSGYSRWLTARMLPSRQAQDLFAGHWELLSGLGAAPRSLVWDNESAVGQWRGGRPQLTAAANAFRGMLGIGIIQCRPADPEAKGLVERANGYLETSFLPGRSFTCPAGLQHPAHAVAGAGEPAAAPGDRVPPRRPARDRPGGDAAAAASSAAGGLVDLGAAAAGPLRASGRQRLLGPSVGDRPESARHRRA